MTRSQLIQQRIKLTPLHGSPLRSKSERILRLIFLGRKDGADQGTLLFEPPQEAGRIQP
jgi:hypothetical protein